MRNRSLALLFFVLLAYDTNANEHPAAAQKITSRLRTHRTFPPPGKSNIYGSLNIKKDDLRNSKFEDCAAIEFVSRNDWNAKPTKDTNHLKVTGGVDLLFYHHTEGDRCYSIKDCAEIIRKWQDYHQLVKGWDDIAYNFLIGDDGRVYVGRDWDRIGAHTPVLQQRIIILRFRRKLHTLRSQRNNADCRPEAYFVWHSNGENPTQLHPPRPKRRKSQGISTKEEAF
uniref:Putative animal peptidoglycan recognition protein n=1 Tax=Ixodes ricinus TaxID=34613 RepID=V5H3E5_IXORI